MTEYLETTVDKFTFKVRRDYLYGEAGVWVAWDSERGTARIGLTDYRQQASGDAAFVDLPGAGTNVRTGEQIAQIETVKVDLEVPAPLDGTVQTANEALESTPELINLDPYGAGWLVELVPAAWPAAGLLDAGAYLSLMEAQAAAGTNP